MRKTLVLGFSMLTLLGATAMLSGCNTVAGAGKDVSATGDAVSKSADKLKP